MLRSFRSPRFKVAKRHGRASSKLACAFGVLSISCVVACVSSATETADGRSAGAAVVDFYGYDDCIELRNSSTRVVLCPAAGGRVLHYSIGEEAAPGGENVLYLPPGDEGWTADGSQTRGPMNAGRFDIGPEMVVPKRELLWQGKWTGEIIGLRQAKLTSPIDPGPGVSLVREFALADEGSKLTCKQTIVSASDEPVEYCHWSRTFAVGKGICIVPLSKPRRFPEGYVRYDGPGKLINAQPRDEHVRHQGEYLVISDHPQNPKLGFDSTAGWLAYHAPQNLLFIKTFPVYPDRAYNEVAGLTISIWYPDDAMVELEPIGPRERLENRGDSAAFTETWYLLNHASPALEQVDPSAVASIVNELRE